jgi:hypothetical protein
MCPKKNPGGAIKRNSNVTAVRRNSYSAGTANAAFRSAAAVLRITNGA